MIPLKSLDLNSNQFDEKLLKKQEKLTKKLESLSQKPSIYSRNYLIVKEKKGELTLSQTHFFEIVWEKFKGMLGFSDKTNRYLIEFAALKLLAKEKVHVTKENYRFLEALVERVRIKNFSDNFGVDHSHLDSLTQEIGQTLHSGNQSRSPNVSSMESTYQLLLDFANTHFEELKSFDKEVNTTLTAFASKKRNEELNSIPKRPPPSIGQKTSEIAHSNLEKEDVTSSDSKSSMPSDPVKNVRPPVKKEAPESKSQKFFSELKENMESFQSEWNEMMKEMEPKRVAIPNTFWALRKVKDLCQSMLFKAPEDKNLPLKLSVQQAIERSDIETLKNTLTNHPHLLEELLPNGQPLLHYAIRLKDVNMVLFFLAVGCDPHMRDFNYQSALDLIQLSDHPDIKESVITFLVRRVQDTFIYRTLSTDSEMKIPDIQKHLLEIENNIRKQIEESKVIDPLAISRGEMATFVAGMIMLILESNSWLLQGEHSFFGFQTLYNLVLGVGALYEMKFLYQNSGEMLSNPLLICSLLSQIAPPFRYVNTVLKTGVLSLSLLNTFRVTVQNASSRKIDSAKKLIVSSFNYYSSISNLFAVKVTSSHKEKSDCEVFKKASCEELKLLQIRYHPDKSKEHTDIYNCIRDLRNWMIEEGKCTAAAPTDD